MFYYIYQPRNPSFPIPIESDFIVRSDETGLGRLTPVVAVISVAANPFFVFSDLICHLEDTGIDVFRLHCTT